MKDLLKVLAVGNSFAIDSMWLLPDILKDLGCEDFCIGILYIGGCPIEKHWNNAANDAAAYTYYRNVGDGWQETSGYSIRRALGEECWDWVNIQHGSSDGNRYTDIACYAHLSDLVEYIKVYAPNAKRCFNMAWVPDADNDHHELRSYGGDQLEMYRNVAALTRGHIATMDCIDAVVPAGTAIQNGRYNGMEGLTRDGFHVSYGLGRYMAGITFLKILTDWDVAPLCWAPDGVDAQIREKAKEAALAAVENPFAISKI